jgi:hypothetical protein
MRIGASEAAHAMRDIPAARPSAAPQKLRLDTRTGRGAFMAVCYSLVIAATWQF